MQLSAQIQSFAVNPSFVNSTQAAFDPVAYANQFQVPKYAIWLNTFWLSALVFSLASASIGISVKQWLKAYSSGLYGSSPDIARRRQYRLNNLLKWQVPLIIALLPVLLLVAMVLFLAGLIVLLSTIHPAVAGVVTVLTSLLIAFFIITTILPAIVKTCSYHSP